MAARAVTRFASDEVLVQAQKPAIAAALEARASLDAAFAAQDADATDALFANDLVVNAPSNHVLRREAVLALFRAGRMDYESVVETFEALEHRGDQVVMMGEEIIKPQHAAPNAGRTVRRRFTDVWRKDQDGQWRLTIRQATIFAVD